MIIKDPVLVVDDEVEMRIAMSAALKRCGYPVELSHNAIDALNKFKKKKYSIVITDMTMPKRSGVELLKDLKAHSPETPVILITAYGTIETAVEAMKYGAFDYIQKPFDFDTFIFLIERALTHTPKLVQNSSAENKKINKTSTNLGIKSSYKDIITEDPKTLKTLEMAKNVADSRATVLIESESGTGKELLARFVHLSSNRSDKPFIAVNCAALPETLLESELFGHKKGAFTGAIHDHRGKFEQANGGTILLDEISEMELPLQAKLLRVLQEQSIDRVGGTESIDIDVRVVATTNRNLLEYVEEKKFREDLYFRLNVIPIELPPLRERKGDIAILAKYFVQKHAQINEKPEPEIHENVFQMLENYHWRGNVRELENVMERALLLSDGVQIQTANLLLSSTSSDSNETTNIPNSIEFSDQIGDTFQLKVGVSMQDAEKQIIFETLKKTMGNRTKAADILGISIRTLRNKLNEYKQTGESLEFLNEI